MLNRFFRRYDGGELSFFIPKGVQGGASNGKSLLGDGEKRVVAPRSKAPLNGPS